MINNGLNLMDVDPFWINGVRGLIILIALLIEAQKVRFKLGLGNQAETKKEAEKAS